MGHSYKDLIVWQKAFMLTKASYKITAQLPTSEQFGLISQAQRCAVSIASNIAEGHQRNNTREFIQFLGIAKGSTAELETQLLLMRDIYSVDVTDTLALLTEVQKLLNSTLKTLRSKL